MSKNGIKKGKTDRREKGAVLTPHLRIAKLSKVELLVLGWIEKGKRNGQIAEILHRSERTVENHVSSILRKLGVETRAAAASVLRKAQENGCNGAGLIPVVRAKR